MENAEEKTTTNEMVARIVTAYVANNTVSPESVPKLIVETRAAFGGEVKSIEKKRPNISPKDSVTDDYIICLEDGKRFKSLKRHLKTVYGMTPADYRIKWGLPMDYPMVAPNYARARSDFAKKMGFGKKKEEAVSE
jgi:predicted transcriptional regulator